MVKVILSTIGTRIIAAILTFAVWVLNANFLDAEKVGTISLIIFSVAIVQLITNFVSGSALIYYTPRVGVYRLIVPAYLLTPLLSALSCCALFFIGHVWNGASVIPAGYFREVFILSMVMSLTSANYMFLLGLERVNQFNKVNLLQVVLLMVILLTFLFLLQIRDVMSYFWAIFLSYCLALVLSFTWLLPAVKRVALTESWSLLKDILRFGTYVQFANIFQTMNYRLSLKFVDLFLGRASVGILTIGVQLAEGLWLISRSIGTVQYSRMSNEMNFDYSVKLTLTLGKISVAITALAMGILLCIPLKFFLIFFPSSFSEIKLVITSLSVGIVMLSGSIILSGFYSAVNKPYHNTISSGIGMLCTVFLGIYLVPEYGIAGAGFTASISYSVITIYQFVVFMRITKVKAGNFLLSWEEISQLYTSIRQLTGKR
jgi:O-antigen/teichoic acid export membrane protein